MWVAESSSAWRVSMWRQDFHGREDLKWDVKHSTAMVLFLVPDRPSAVWFSTPVRNDPQRRGLRNVGRKRVLELESNFQGDHSQKRGNRTRVRRVLTFHTRTMVFISGIEK